MYKLLLATNRPEILNAFEAVSSWEGMGFRPPRIASSAEEAIDILSRHHVDGIAYALDSKDEWALHYHLRDNYPILPIFEAASTHADVMRSITELRSLLNRLRSDYSDDNTSAQDMLQICRHDFFRALLGGRVHGRKEVITHLQLLRSRMDPNRPCVVVDMHMPGGETYLSGRWHYGAERLEVAMRNIMGVELNGMRMLVSVLPDERVKLLCCPMLGADVHADSITATVSEHAQASMEHIREYLDLSLEITNIEILPALTALAAE